MDSDELRGILNGMAFMQSLSDPLRDKVSRVLQEVAALRSVPLGETWIRE
ncbi:MAG: hypothetical protein IT364_00765 [Candidatus Hydrogenedentes bacterium]|nr:hypothetical protein [Candidatus Hydrogenedentota bacterium]